VRTTEVESIAGAAAEAIVCPTSRATNTMPRSGHTRECLSPGDASTNKS
jgi:hypothetical protein